MNEVRHRFGPTRMFHRRRAPYPGFIPVFRHSSCPGPDHIRKTRRHRNGSHLLEDQLHPENKRTCFEGPFGEVVRATGPLAKANPFRFSTKYQDDETDLLYYDYRYYSAITGRWASRDAAEEAGGLDLYTFNYNAPPVWIDSNGLDPEGWSSGDYIKQDRPDPRNPSGWRSRCGTFMKAPEPTGGTIEQPPFPPPPRGIGVPSSQSVGSAAGGRGYYRGWSSGRRGRCLQAH